MACCLAIGMSKDTGLQQADSWFCLLEPGPKPELPVMVLPPVIVMLVCSLTDARFGMGLNRDFSLSGSIKGEILC